MPGARVVCSHAWIMGPESQERWREVGHGEAVRVPLVKEIRVQGYEGKKRAVLIVVCGM